MERRSFIRRVLGILALPFVGKAQGLDRQYVSDEVQWRTIGPATEIEWHWAEVYNEKTGEVLARWNSLQGDWIFADGSRGNYVQTGPDDSVRCSWGEPPQEWATGGCAVSIACGPAPVGILHGEVSIQKEIDDIGRQPGMTRELGSRTVNPTGSTTARTRWRRVRAFLSGTV